jgi:hypothetical protein
MPVDAWWGYQGRDAMNQLQWREHQFIYFTAPLVIRRLTVLFGAAVHQVGAVFAQPIHGQWWPGAVAQKSLQCGTVVFLNAHTGIKRKTAVLVSQHLFGVGLLDQIAPDEGAQDAFA